MNHTVYYHFWFLFVRRVTLLLEGKDIITVSTESRRRRVRYTSWWEQRVVVLAADARVVPMSNWQRDGVWACNNFASELAKKLGCKHLEVPEDTDVRVAVEAGRTTTSLRPYGSWAGWSGTSLIGAGVGLGIFVVLHVNRVDAVAISSAHSAESSAGTGTTARRRRRKWWPTVAQLLCHELSPATTVPQPQASRDRTLSGQSSAPVWNRAPSLQAASVGMCRFFPSPPCRRGIASRAPPADEGRARQAQKMVADGGTTVVPRILRRRRFVTILLDRFWRRGLNANSRPHNTRLISDDVRS